MDDLKEFDKELDEIRKKLIIEVNNWWGHRYSGSSGTIVTADKCLYEYQYYNKIPPQLEGKNVNFIEKKKLLNDTEFNKITEFIENEIIEEEFDNRMILDAGYNVIVNYKGVSKEIVNNIGYNGRVEIYEKAKAIINGETIVEPSKFKIFLNEIKEIFTGLC